MIGKKHSFKLHKDIYNDIDKKELKESYLVHIPQLVICVQRRTKLADSIKSISATSNHYVMRSIIGLALLLSLVLPSMALSPVEQAYVDGVNDGVKLGRLVNNVEQYNIAVQQFNDKINQTFGANASAMWLPKIATNNTLVPDIFTSMKPIHKMDGNPGEVIVVQN